MNNKHTLKSKTPAKAQTNFRKKQRKLMNRRDRHSNKKIKE